MIDSTRALTLALLLTFTTGLRAQFGCFGDDGFSVPGTCCIPRSAADITLPFFPAVTLPAEAAAFQDCSLLAASPTTISLGTPIPIFCDLYFVPITFIGGGVNVAPTFMLARYTRTWVEADPTGVSQQVWRFLVNMDLTYLPAFSTPWPTPDCAATSGLKVHYTGSLDYADGCPISGNFQAALNLVHFGGDLSHGNLSQRPTASSHPGHIYAFVGPTPFDWTAPGATPQGFPVGESVRSTDADLQNGVWDCYSDAFILGGGLTTVQNSCPGASSASAPGRFEEMDLQLDYGCGGPTLSYLSIPFPPLLPTGLTVFPLGTYALPFGTWPGTTSVATCFGTAAAPDPCGNNFPFHLVHGVMTTGGDFALLYGSPVGSNQFVDLENMLVYMPSPPYMLIGYGSLFLSTMNWSANF